MFKLLIYIAIASSSIAASIPQMAYVGEGKFKQWGNNIEIHVKSFHIDIYEVTNAEYLDYVETTGQNSPIFIKNDNFNLPVQPVVGVSFNDAVNYCKWVGKRLPNEFEWQKAASYSKKTDTTLRYPWGNTWDIYRLNTIETGPSKTTIVGMYPQGKSPYGIYDMGGNVWEWTSSEYKEQVTGIKNFRRIIKGGSWGNKDNNDYVNPSMSGALEEQLKLSNVGFRCAK